MARKVLDDNGVLYLWNKIKAKFVEQEDGKGLSANDYTDAEKTKLAGIEVHANYYKHPTGAGYSHIPVGGSSGQILRWSAAGTAAWGADKDTTYTAATTTTDGLMSAADKTKLNGIATGANKTTVDAALSGTSTNPVQNKAVNTALAGKLNASARGAKNGVASLDADGRVPSSQLPSYVDDVIEGYYYNDKFYKESAHTTEITGEGGKIYVDLSTNLSYRYGGSTYVQITSSDMVAITNAEIDAICV